MCEGLNCKFLRMQSNNFEVRTSPTMTYVPRHQRPTYIGTNDLRSTTTRREGLFGGSIHIVWRLHPPRLEAPFTPFGDCKLIFSNLCIVFA